jgi:hypothetical protein
MRKIVTKRRLLWFGAFAAVFFGALLYTGYRIAAGVEPFLREQTIAYLRDKYKAEVDLGAFHVSTPVGNPLAIFRAKSRGVQVRVDRIVVKRPGQQQLPPLMSIRKLTFRVQVPTLWNPPVTVDHLLLEGLELHIPPKAERGKLIQEREPAPESALEPEQKPPAAIINTVDADGAVLVVYPKNPDKEPLRFDMQKLRLHSAGPGIPMRYDTILRNPKPPGIVACNGSFGPFDAGSPGDSPLTGKYTFSKADLGVFKGIAGTLFSTGEFQGTLDEIVVDGQANVPDFRLTHGGNRVPLKTKFHAIVDGTNGNTLLQPVQATLGRTGFAIRGGVVRYRGENGKTVALDVACQRGDVSDFLRLVLKGNTTPLTGGIGLKIKLEVPPGKEQYADRLIVSGSFGLMAARFTSPQVQERIDDLSRRARGKPRATEIEDVPSDFSGRLHLRNGNLTLKQLQFGVAGADVLLNGVYDLNDDSLDFRGVARTRARLSQMTKSRWKGLLLKPVDPFFAKDGAGGVFPIAITGTRQEPKFGLDRGNGDDEKHETERARK